MNDVVSQRRIAGGQSCDCCGETVRVTYHYCPWCGEVLRDDQSAN